MIDTELKDGEAENFDRIATLDEMEEIKGFKLSDGRIIENKEEAIKIQKEIDFKKAVWDFSQREGIYECKDAIYDAIIDNVDELRKIFNAL